MHYIMVICCNSSALQDASSISNMQLSSKRVSLLYLTWAECQFDLLNINWIWHWSGYKLNSQTCYSILCRLTATAVCELWHRHSPSSTSPLQCVWKGLCRVLPSQRPILCLGWNILYTLPAKHQEVCDTLVFAWLKSSYSDWPDDLSLLGEPKK